MPHLASELGVSERTIQRDIAELMLEYPIETVQGRYGGIKVLDSYHSERKYLTSEQIALLKHLTESLDDNDQKTLKDILFQFSP